MIEYWWVLFLIIVVILIYSIFYKKNNKKKNKTINRKKTINSVMRKNGIEKINLGYVLKELPVIAPYYINSL